MKKIKIFIFLFLLLFSLEPVGATGSWGVDDVVNSKEDVKSALGVQEVNTYGDPGGYISARAGLIIGSILSFIGVIFMILVIYGGFLWMTARGNEQQVEKAKTLIIQSVIGLIIVLSAYAITSLVGGILTNPEVKLTN